MIHSIRGRLSLSHALVALVTTFLLGGLVIASLATYYRLRERVYLVENANALGNLLGSLIIEESDLNLITAQINTFSFLTQTRVRLIDTEGRVLADSGSPAAQSGVATINLTLENENILQTFSRQISQEEDEIYLTEIVLNDGTQSIRLTTSIQGGEIPEVDQPLTTPFSLFTGGLTPAELAPENRRSVEIEAVPIRTLRGETIAVVELSEGPAYGRPVVLSVLFSSLIAGLLAFFAAGLLGRWLSGRVSRPIVQLAHTAEAVRRGDLSARANIDRQDEIGQLAHSFDQMAARLEENVLTLRRFVWDASHEFRTPLTAVRSNLELLQEDPHNSQFITAAIANANRLNLLLDDLLHLAQGENESAFELVPVEITNALQTWCEPAAAAAEQKGVVFDLDLPQDLVWVPGHRVSLMRTISNLLDNAVKFTPSGGRIDVMIRPREQEVEISIRDTGIGLGKDPEALFERFARAPQALEYPGSGLGLAVVRQLVKIHRGTIQGRNTPDGAIFIMTLPRIDNP